ncbi:hypothetical protein KM1_294590 [Entamoeba histolytica HM-3:IMSS]|uniref:Uncharacterized protein n=1 Tax=Entamoeba histolytica HM-3:IMSS TaxID=885315 RepID=M7WHA7_ENTHI|nr:hypothetical protein KM1_294590 [Entamoeba histolytica HM-3:IMSS]
MNEAITSKPLIITDENSLFSLLEEQQEDFEIVKQSICETPKYFKEAVEIIIMHTSREYKAIDL